MLNKMDYAHKQADKELKRLEKRLKKEYSKAASEAYKKARSYLDGFYEADKILAKKVKDGQMPEKMYKQWRTTQLTMGEQWENVTAQMLNDYQHANEIASEMITNHSYDVFATNFNYGTFEAETASLVNTSFTLYDKNTVEVLLRDNPKLLPNLSENLLTKKAQRWTRQQINSIALQSIIQGDSIPRIAQRIANETGTKNFHSAVRTARTMTTSAENVGRVASYQRAKNMGIEMLQEWLATSDNRTRHSHLEMNGERVEVGGKFSNGLRYPGDPEGKASEVYNCRCTLVGALGGIDYDVELDADLYGMSYKEWASTR